MTSELNTRRTSWVSEGEWRRVFVGDLETLRKRMCRREESRLAECTRNKSHEEGEGILEDCIQTKGEKWTQLAQAVFRKKEPQARFGIPMLLKCNIR